MFCPRRQQESEMLTSTKMRRMMKKYWRKIRPNRTRDGSRKVMWTT
jgi:hypothetical protein